MGSSSSKDVSLETSRSRKKTRRAAQPRPMPMQTASSAEPVVVTASTAAPAAAAVVAGGLSTMQVTPSFMSLLPIGSGHSMFGATPANQLDLPSAKASAPMHSEQASTASEVRLAWTPYCFTKPCSMQNASDAMALLCSLLGVSALCAVHVLCLNFRCCAVLKLRCVTHVDS